MIAVVTDSTCDLPEDMAERYRVHVVAAYINIGGESLKDGIDITRAQVYQKFAGNGETPKTASPSPGEFASLYDRLLEKASHIVSIHIASQFSGVFSAASVAAAQVDPNRVTVIDSGQISMGLGWAALSAAEAAKNSANLEGVLHSAQDALRRVRLYALLDTLSYLARSGRVDFVRAGLSAALNIKPILEIQAGTVKTKERIRTWSRATAALTQLTARAAPLSALAVLHTNIEDEAGALLDSIKSAATLPEQTLIVNITPTIGIHTGPKTLGIAALLAT